MPIYEYRCENGHTFEVMQRMTDDPIEACEMCGAPVQRVFHPVAVHFKGSGFYNTDYGKRKRGASASRTTPPGGRRQARARRRPDTARSRRARTLSAPRAKTSRIVIRRTRGALEHAARQIGLLGFLAAHLGRVVPADQVRARGLRSPP